MIFDEGRGSSWIGGTLRRPSAVVQLIGLAAGLLVAHGTVRIGLATSPLVVVAYASDAVARAVLTLTLRGVATALLADSLAVAVAADRSVLAVAG
jgi:hypothetical protein